MSTKVLEQKVIEVKPVESKIEQKIEFNLDNPELNLIESNKFLLEHGLKEYVKAINYDDK